MSFSLRPYRAPDFTQARFTARSSGAADKLLINLGGKMWCLLPWLGTYAFLALERFLRLRCGEALGGLLFQFSAARFKLFLGLLGGVARAACGDEVVAGVTVFDLDDVAEVAEVDNLVEKNDFHVSAPFRFCACRNTAAAQGNARA